MNRVFYLLFTICLCVQTLGFAQTKLIKGIVLDEHGEGLPGAGIKVKGTTIGTLTDVDGSFSIDVDEKYNVLEISSLGYESTETNVANRQGTLNIQLKAKSTTLEETVVTALNIKRDKKALGYSVSEVKSDAIEKSGERNAIQSLAAKAPGIQVTSSSGVPGASSKIRIRGNSTFTGNNEPLVVVDGIPIDNNTTQTVPGDYPYNVNLSGVNESNRALDINPDDIESVSLLKGPAASNLYGSRGANGAIIITTKKGAKGSKGIGLTLTSSVEMNHVNKLPEMQKIYAQGRNGIYETGTTPLSWGPRIDTTNLNTYNNFGNFFQTGVGFNNTVAITNGFDKGSFRASIGNYNTTGIMPNSSMNRTNVTLNSDYRVNEWLKIGGSANYTYNEGRKIQNGSNTAGTMLSLFRMPATYDITDGYYDAQFGTTKNYFVLYDNPLFTAYRNTYSDVTNRLLGNLYTDIDIAKGLVLSMRGGTDFYGTQITQIYDLNSTGNDLSNGNGQLNKSSINFLQVYTDALLKYNVKLGKNFDLFALAGYNYWYNERKIAFMRGADATIPNYYNLNGYSNLYASSMDEFSQSNAVFAEVNLGYKSFLYVTISGRNEWHSAFGKNSSGFFYPKGDVSWIFSEHIPSNDVISYGKLRVAIAQAGVPPTPYSDRIYYEQPFLTDGFTNGNGFPYMGMNGYMVPTVNNPGNLKPEIVEGTELGLEARFWKNRISFEFALYNQESRDLLLRKPVAPSTGFRNEYVNAGKMRNRGIELSLNIEAIKTKDFQLSLGGNWAKNVNTVLALDKGVSEISLEEGFESIGSYAIVGQPYGVFYASKWKRNDQGKIIVSDEGLPIIDEKFGKVGNPNPNWLMGLNMDLRYKNISVNMLWDIRNGGDIWNGTYARLNQVGRTLETADRERTFIVDGVTENGSINSTPISAEEYWRYFKGDQGATENSIQDGSWVRLRSLGISYRYDFKTPSEGGRKQPFKYFEFGITCRNLLLFTDYKGVDPETSLTGADSNIGGWDYFNNPGTKSYIVSLKLGL